ncbi:MAG: fatty acid desaturase [Gammaproteobacteria bacterium]|nr:fatty acid desaturase [Gammaproteobacteria bacterium]
MPRLQDDFLNNSQHESEMQDALDETVAGNCTTASPRIANLTRTRKAFGYLLTLNFAVLWAAPIVIQGQTYRHGLKRIFRPLYRFIDGLPGWRSFAVKNVYRMEADAAYFTAAVLCFSSTVAMISIMLWWQVLHGSLPWWLIALYYFHWVGPGGRMMGVAYTFAHREGHRPGGGLYRSSLGNLIGNPFENILGLWYGVIPNNFSTSHVLLHHRLDGGKGDPIFLWDLDRTKFGDLMLYQWRMFRWMTGFGSLAEFQRQSGVHPAIDKARISLRRGMITYYLHVPAIIVVLLIAAGSTLLSALLFLFFIYLQPLLCMSTFLALINVGQHGFLEFDADGKHIPLVTATTILDGHDDSFGEDYHFAHHFAPVVQLGKLRENIIGKKADCQNVNGAVFRETTIFEIAIMLHMGKFKELISRHYVDFSDKEATNVDELAELFEDRAKRREMSYEEYEFTYLPTLRSRVRKLVQDGVCPDENRAYIYQANRVA